MIKPLVSTLVGLTVLDTTLKITREIPRSNRRRYRDDRQEEKKSFRRL